MIWLFETTKIASLFETKRACYQTVELRTTQNSFVVPSSQILLQVLAM